MRRGPQLMPAVRLGLVDPRPARLRLVRMGNASSDSSKRRRAACGVDACSLRAHDEKLWMLVHGGLCVGSFFDRNVDKTAYNPGAATSPAASSGPLRENYASLLHAEALLEPLHDQVIRRHLGSPSIMAATALHLGHLSCCCLPHLHTHSWVRVLGWGWGCAVEGAAPRGHDKKA